MFPQLKMPYLRTWNMLTCVLSGHFPVLFYLCYDHHISMRKKLEGCFEILSHSTFWSRILESRWVKFAPPPPKDQTAKWERGPLTYSPFSLTFSVTLPVVAVECPVVDCHEGWVCSLPVPSQPHASNLKIKGSWELGFQWQHQVLP